MSSVSLFNMSENKLNKYLGAGTSYNITNITSLPEKFTDDFGDPETIANGVPFVGIQKDMRDNLYATVHLLITTKSAAISSCTFKVQGSNIGGTDARCWADISGAAVTPTDIGTYIINLPASLKSTKYIRILGNVTGANLEFYMIGFGYKNM